MGKWGCSYHLLMIISVQKNYIVFTAETQEESAKLSEASLLLRQVGHDIPLLAYRTIEIPLGGLTQRKVNFADCHACGITYPSTANRCSKCGGKLQQSI